MDIAGMSMAMKSLQLNTQVQNSVMKMAMDSVQQSADLIAQMTQQLQVQREVVPHLGRNLDAMI